MKKGTEVRLPYGNAVVEGVRHVKGGDCILVTYTSGFLKDRQALVERRWVRPGG